MSVRTGRHHYYIDAKDRRRCPGDAFEDIILNDPHCPCFGLLTSLVVPQDYNALVVLLHGLLHAPLVRYNDGEVSAW